MKELPAVRVGQVWRDNDPRAEGRTIRVEEIYEEAGRVYARCANVTVGKNTGDYAVGANVRIMVKRFRPVRSGYTLVKDAPQDERQETA